MVAFINQQVAAKTDLKIALTEVCQVLICLNEFVYVD